MSRFANGIRGSAVKFPPSRLPGSLAVHFSGMGVIRPSGGANAVAGCWPTPEEHIPSGSDRVRVGLLSPTIRFNQRLSDLSHISFPRLVVKWPVIASYFDTGDVGFNRLHLAVRFGTL